MIYLQYLVRGLLTSGPDLAGDVNNDGIVDLQDLFDVLGNWLN